MARVLLKEAWFGRPRGDRQVLPFVRRVAGALARGIVTFPDVTSDGDDALLRTPRSTSAPPRRVVTHARHGLHAR
jgi:hypothetical protein